MKRTVVDAYRRLGTPDALSWINVAVIFTLQVSGSAISSLVDFEGRTALFFGVRIASLLCFAVVIFIGRLALNRWAQSRPLPLITLATFMAALFAGTAAFDALLVFTGLAPEFELGRRLVTSTVGVLTSQILTSLLVTYSRDFSNKNAELLHAAEELVKTRHEATARITRRREELIADIRDEISSELSKLGDAGSSQDAQHMRALIDDVVRPISYSLAREVSAEPEAPVAPTITPIDWMSVLRTALRRNPFHWIATPLMFAAIGASFLISTFQLRGATTLLALVVVVGVFNVLGRLLWPRLPAAIGTLPRGFIFASSTAVLGLFTAHMMTFLTGFSFIEPLRLFSWFMIANLAAWTVTLVSSVNAMLRETNDALSRTVDELKREVIALKSAYRQLRQGIARVMHGPVQQAITSTLVRVQSQPETLNDIQLAESLRTKIYSALDSLTATAEARADISAVLSELEELWIGAVEISTKITPEDISWINADQTLAHSLSELIREGCSNAIRHGNAKKIWISIRVIHDSRCVDLRIENDGAKLPLNSRVGLGSDLFEESCLNWSRTQKGAHVALTATLPLSITR